MTMSMEFAKNLLSAKRELSYCSICGNLTDEEECAICRDETRDPSTILVVEDSRDVSAMENIQEYHGRYHVPSWLDFAYEWGRTR